MKHLPFLKLVYRGLLTGMPMFTYNPITKNNLHSPFTVKPYSTYINYKLNNNQVNWLNDYIHEYNKNIELVPIQLAKYDNPEYYLSINIYNATSPIMLTNKDIIRCEINTYIKMKDGTLGTLILDYVSNTLSMDPINIFKKNINQIKFYNDLNINILYVNSIEDDILLDFNYKITNDNFYISNKLIEFTDLAFYKNGIADKVYYDSTLGSAVTKYGEIILPTIFKYKNMEFLKPDSVFYFDKSLNFIGSMWNNL